MLNNHAPIELSSDFNYVLDKIENTKESVFVTGRAGTGKSTLLQIFRNTTEKNVVVLAPTGVAALNVRGQTIHSFFGFPPKLLDPSQIRKRKNRALFKKIEVLIIDEISMVRADLLDNIDHAMRINRGSYEPFGGVQVIFFGDLFQLPPVVSSDIEAQVFTSKYSTPFFFSAHVITQGFDFETIELQKVYRQESKSFLKLLDSIRLNRLDYEDFEMLNARYTTIQQEASNIITLTATNYKAQTINQKKLAEIEAEESVYHSKTTGEYGNNYLPADEILRLKVHAQVMFVRNDPDRKFVNGTLGIVEELTASLIKVRVNDSEGRRTIELTPAKWELIKYEIDEKDSEKIVAKTIGTFEQFPIKLAWAITIHKSQGKTFDTVIIDLGRGAFEHGQTYVALSRCRTLEGIFLKQPITQKDIIIDEKIVEYYLAMR